LIVPKAWGAYAGGTLHSSPFEASWPIPGPYAWGIRKTEIPTQIDHDLYPSPQAGLGRCYTATLQAKGVIEKPYTHCSVQRRCQFWLLPSIAVKSPTSRQSVDYQFRYFESDDEDEVLQRLRSEEPITYKNSAGETVSWIFDRLEAVEHDIKFKDGAEIIGFITGELKDVTKPISGANAG
jgi:hypothetical protein